MNQTEQANSMQKTILLILFAISFKQEKDELPTSNAQHRMRVLLRSVFLIK